MLVQFERLPLVLSACA